MRKVVRTLPVALALALLACGTTTLDEAVPADEEFVENLPADADDSVGSSEPSPEEAATTSTIPGQVTYSVDGSFDTADDYHYAFQLTATMAPYLDPSEQRPGFTSIGLRVLDSYWQFENLLPEREAPRNVLITGSGPSVYGLFKTDRPTCQLGVELPPVPGIGEARCRLVVGVVNWVADSPQAGVNFDIAPGGSVSGEVVTDPSQPSFRIPEADAQVLFDDLAKGPDETAVASRLFGGLAHPDSRPPNVAT